MKIAVPAKGATQEDAVDARFGRCACFLVAESDTTDVTVLENPNRSLGGGAGIQTAQLLADHDVDVVLTGNCGPNAYQTLEAAGIDVIVDVSGTVREALEAYRAGRYQTASGANVQRHFGTAD